MSANPLEDDPGRDHRIRERAYHLWNDEGRPHGREHEFWERARELVGMQDSAGAGQLPNPQGAGTDPTLGQPVEEAFLQDNLGEFPDRFADQGEVAPTPKAPARPSRAKATPKTEAAAKPVAPAKSAASAKKGKPKG